MTVASEPPAAKEIDDGGEAERLVEEAIAAAGSHRDADQTGIAHAMLHLAEVQERRRDFGRAEGTFREALRLYRHACGREDARSRHAQLALADHLRRTGQVQRALTAYRLYVPARSERPAWLDLQIEALEHDLGLKGRADRTLDAAVDALSRDHGGDPMTTSATFIRTAQRLVERSRLLDAQALLDQAIAGVEDVIAGRRMSMSARVHSQVLAELRAARAALGG